MILLGLLTGLLSPVQTVVNKKLRRRVGSPYYSGEISYSIAFVFLIAAFLLTGMQGIEGIGALRGEPLWIYLGGILGVLFVTGNVLLIEKIGAVQTVIFPALGQILMGILSDHFGWFRSEVIRLTASRLIGAALVFAGVLITVGVKQKTEQDGRSPEKSLLLWQLLGIGTGALRALQTAINGAFGAVLHSPLLSTTINFFIGSAFFGMICLILTPKIRKSREMACRSHEPAKLWVWLGGGAVGAVVVMFSTILARTIGTGLTVITFLIGASASGALIDHFGLFGTEVKKMTPAKAAGIAVMIAGVLMVRMVTG